MDVQLSNSDGVKLPTIENYSGPVESKTSNPINTLLRYIVDPSNLINKYALLKIS